MAKSREELLAHLQEKPRHCTIKDVGDALEAYDFTYKRRGNTHVWQYRGFIVVLHTPHEKFVKRGAVDDAITNIELAEQARRTGNGSP